MLKKHKIAIITYDEKKTTYHNMYAYTFYSTKHVWEKVDKSILSKITD